MENSKYISLFQTTVHRQNQNILLKERTVLLSLWNSLGLSNMFCGVSIEHSEKLVLFINLELGIQEDVLLPIRPLQPTAHVPSLSIFRAKEDEMKLSVCLIYLKE